jgi:tRNA G10  N-methylase Trm11
LKDMTMLDPSAGWGDRLITAMALGIGHYIGFDPNRKMYPIYEKITDDLKESSNTATTFYATRFKKIPGFTVDIVLTSPPFYDYELYNGTEADVKVPYKQWLRELYTPYIKDAIDMLRFGGWFCIYIDNVKYKLADDTHRIMEGRGMKFIRRLTFHNSYITYCGETQEGTPRSMWCWRKTC